ncbi:Carbonic AnHydrase [Chamberlinius hualienensis]
MISRTSIFTLFQAIILFSFTNGEEIIKPADIECADNRSLINIEVSKVLHDNNAQCLQLSNYDNLPESLIGNNTGQSFKLHYLQSNMSLQAHVVYNGVKYFFEHAGFIFGDNSTKGSIHTINHMKFPLEMQMVHRNEKYTTIEDAGKNSDGLLIIAILFVATNDGNMNIRGLVYFLHAVQFKGQQHKLDVFPLTYLMPCYYGFYYSYKGPNTIPPCYSSVQWIIFHNAVPIDEYQLGEFRKLQSVTKEECPKELCPLWGNFRDRQNYSTIDAMWKEQCRPTSGPEDANLPTSRNSCSSIYIY